MYPPERSAQCRSEADIPRFCGISEASGGNSAQNPPKLGQLDKDVFGVKRGAFSSQHGELLVYHIVFYHLTFMTLKLVL